MELETQKRSFIRKFLILTLMLVLLGTVAVSADTGVVTANGGLNMRTGSGTGYDVVTVIPSGTVVDIIGCENNWLQVTYNGQTGFVSPQYLYVRTGNELSRSGGDRVGAEVVAYAKQFIGTPYVYGGSSTSGFDCSGFTQYVFRQFGYSLNRTAAGQASNGVYVAKSELQPGDLLLFNCGSGGIDHAGIYAGNGQMIHAVKPGVSLRVESMSGYYNNHYVTARRIVQ